MKERTWLLLRGARPFRKFYALPVFATPIRSTSYSLVRSSDQTHMGTQELIDRMRVTNRAGTAK
jgi:hypothetical protein